MTEEERHPLAAEREDWAVGFEDETWWSRLARPALHAWGDGEPLRLEPYERSRSLAIHPKRDRFVLGTESGGCAPTTLRAGCYGGRPCLEARGLSTSAATAG